MAAKKKTGLDPWMFPPSFTSKEEALAGLRERGYDDAAISRFAASIRSWTPRDSDAWKMWKDVELAVHVPSPEGKKEG